MAGAAEGAAGAVWVRCSEPGSIWLAGTRWPSAAVAEFPAETVKEKDVALPAAVAHQPPNSLRRAFPTQKLWERGDMNMGVNLLRRRAAHYSFASINLRASR